jgi:hypothetical protein
MVLKSFGETEPFSEGKVYRSLKKAGVSGLAADEIVARIEKKIYPNIKTSEIFKMIKSELGHEYPQAATRFNLKEGMRNLGPDGFSFEKYVREILTQYGFAVKIDKYIPGRCIAYETDILAENEKAVYFGECKYRNRAGERIDLSVCMKLFAAAIDVKAGNYFKKEINAGKEIRPILITNAKFSNQAIRYSECQGIRLLGWNYPKGNGLEKMIDAQKLYPITILPSFKKYMNAPFGKAGMMLSQDLLNIKDLAKFCEKVEMPQPKIQCLLNEAKTLFPENAPIVKV